MRRNGGMVLVCGLLCIAGWAQSTLPVKWEEMTAPDFVRAIHQARGTCLLPIGIVEKHGPHLPLGTDLFNVRYAAVHAANKEYAVVFPSYFFGQIFEARHEPGTLAYSAALQLELLQATSDEMARNGCKKIVIVNGHGGNESLLPYFAQTQMAAPHDYVVYIYGIPHLKPAGRPAMQSSFDYHAGEAETAHTMISRPDLVHLDRAGEESGANQQHQRLPASLYTGIWWYAKFPNHYAGDARAANTTLGAFDMAAWVEDLASAVKAVKADQDSLRLQNEFYEKAGHPLLTAQ